MTFQCKYGSECRNDNVAHRTLYSHPSSSPHTSSPNPKTSSSPSPPTTCPFPPLSSQPPCTCVHVAPLPDVFVGVRVHVADHVEDADLLRRYVTAYGGDLTPDYRLSEATHVLVSRPVGEGYSALSALVAFNTRLNRVDSKEKYSDIWSLTTEIHRIVTVYIYDHFYDLNCANNTFTNLSIIRV